MLDHAGFIARGRGLNDDGVGADFIKDHLEGEGAIQRQLGGIQIFMGREHLDIRPGNGGAADGHGFFDLGIFSLGVLFLGFIIHQIGAPAGGDIGRKVQSDLLGLAIEDDGHGVFPVILGAGGDGNSIFTDRGNRSVVGNQAVLGIDQVGIILAVDIDGAVFGHFELDIVKGGGNLHIIGGGGNQIQGRQGNFHLIGYLLQGLLFPGGGFEVRGQGSSDGFLGNALGVFIPGVIGHLNGGIAADDLIGFFQFLDPDDLALFPGQKNAVGGKIIEDGGGDDGLLLQGGLPALQHQGFIEELISCQQHAGNHQRKGQKAGKPAGAEAAMHFHLPHGDAVIPAIGPGGGNGDFPIGVIFNAALGNDRNGVRADVPFHGDFFIGGIGGILGQGEGRAAG